VGVSGISVMKCQEAQSCAPKGSVSNASRAEKFR
jgi:hypothetical protein